MTEPLLRLHGVTKSFGGITAIKDVSLSITRGEIGGIIGPNGAGKTTVFNVITGAYTVNFGRILLNGQPINQLKPHRIARLGIARTFQNIRLFDSMTVWEHLLVAQPRTLSDRSSPAGAAEVLSLLGLERYRHRLARSLPYGIQRKVEIARALTSAPQLLLLDEPVAGMNPEESEDLRRLLLRLKARGLTLLVIEHDMPFVMGLCDYLYVLDFGTVIAAGDPASIRRNPVVIDAYMGQDVDAVG
jgi:branched-chain amino acid transport system ATP-binding protein